MRFALAVFAVLLASGAAAQETYSLPATAQRVIEVTAQVRIENYRTCKRLNLGIGCSQGAACVAASAAGGNGCNATQARAASARIYDPATFAGREEWVQRALVAPVFDDRAAAIPTLQDAIRCDRWKTLSRAEKDVACLRDENGPQEAGCELCR